MNDKIDCYEIFQRVSHFNVLLGEFNVRRSKKAAFYIVRGIAKAFFTNEFKFVHDSDKHSPVMGFIYGVFWTGYFSHFELFKSKKMPGYLYSGRPIPDWVEEKVKYKAIKTYDHVEDDFQYYDILNHLEDHLFIERGKTIMSICSRVAKDGEKSTFIELFRTLLMRSFLAGYYFREELCNLPDGGKPKLKVVK